MIDATVVRAHQHSAGARKKGDSNEAIGRSRGGLTTKIDAIVDALGNPPAASLTGGHVHDVKQAQLLTQKKSNPQPSSPTKAMIATASSSISKSAASSPSFRRGQIARRRASATSRSCASATSWNVSSTSSSTFAPSQPATKRLPETSSQASTSSAPWLGSNDDRPLVSLLPLYWRSRLYNHAAAATTTGSPTKAPAKGNTARHSSMLIVASSLAPPASSLVPAALPTMYVARPSEVGTTRIFSGFHPTTYDRSMPIAA